MNKLSKSDRALLTRINRVLGGRFDPMPAVEGRAEELLGDRAVIVWEVDPTNFRFQYVSSSAERILGYPPARWITDPAFWVEQVVLREDVPEAVAALALATGNGIDQDFEFRAVASDGRVIPFRMLVRTMLGVRGVATHMRGLMIAQADRRQNAARLRPGTPLPFATPPGGLARPEDRGPSKRPALAR